MPELTALPLAALAPLMRDAGALDAAARFAAAGETLATLRHAAVLVVDDAMHLDDLSAAAVYQACRIDGLRVLLTRRTGLLASKSVQSSAILTGTYTITIPQQATDKTLDRYQEKMSDNGYGFNITKLTDVAGKPLADCYLGVDDEPAPLHEVVAWLREQLGVSHWSDEQRVRRAGSKRCRNARARALGWAPQYPSYREGYAAILQGQ